jgi:hypothetical protein
MQRLFFISVLSFLFLSLESSAQSLDFLGISDVHFGMKVSEMTNKTLLIDSTSAYKDTATYLRNSRCHTYSRKAENLKLPGFTASRIEYQFCDGQLVYVFVYVKGKTEIERSLNELKKTFPKLGCKGKKLLDCPQLDASSKGMRVIVNTNLAKEEMSFVLISKRKAGK